MVRFAVCPLLIFVCASLVAAQPGVTPNSIVLPPQQAQVQLAPQQVDVVIPPPQVNISQAAPRTNIVQEPAVQQAPPVQQIQQVPVQQLQAPRYPMYVQAAPVYAASYVCPMPVVPVQTITRSVVYRSPVVVRDIAPVASAPATIVQQTVNTNQRRGLLGGGLFGRRNNTPTAQQQVSTGFGTVAQQTVR